MSRGTEQQLGDLHGRVAKVLNNALGHVEHMQDEYEKNAGEDIYPEINPALLSVAIKFLDSNSITVAVEDSSAMSEMKDRLEARKAKRQARSVGNVTYLDETG